MEHQDSAEAVTEHFTHQFSIPPVIWWCASGIALLIDLVGNLLSVASIPRLGQDHQSAGIAMMAMMGFYIILLGLKIFIVLRRSKYAHKSLKLYLRWTGIHAAYVILCLIGLFIVVIQIPAASQQSGSFFGAISGGAQRYNMLITDAFLTVLSGALWVLNLVTVPRKSAGLTN